MRQPSLSSAAQPKLISDFSSPNEVTFGLPYWKERNLEIDIAKDVHPKLGPEKKQAALNAALEKRG